MNIDKLTEEWRSLDKADQGTYLKRGQILSEAKAGLEHGSFLEFLKRIDTKPRTAQRFMRIYTVCQNTPTLARLNLSPSKLDIIAQVDDIASFIEEFGDELESMTVRELRELVKGSTPEPEEPEEPDEQEDSDVVMVTVRVSRSDMDTLEQYAPYCEADAVSLLETIIHEKATAISDALHIYHEEWCDEAQVENIKDKKPKKKTARCTEMPPELDANKKVIVRTGEKAVNDFKDICDQYEFSVKMHFEIYGDVENESNLREIRETLAETYFNMNRLIPIR